jgi:hypothetical protein
LQQSKSSNYWKISKPGLQKKDLKPIERMLKALLAELVSSKLTNPRLITYLSTSHTKEVRFERDFAAAKEEWLAKKEAARLEAEKKKQAFKQALNAVKK